MRIDHGAATEHTLGVAGPPPSISQRKDHARVSVTQLCASTGQPALVWALVLVENRGAEPLTVQHLVLEAVATGHAFEDRASQRVTLPATLAADGHAYAVVYHPMSLAQARSQAWTLRMTFDSARRRPIELGPFTFSS